MRTTSFWSAASEQDRRDVIEVFGEELTDDPRQLALLARFAREVRDLTFADPTWTPKRRAAMRRWLDEAVIEFDGRPYTARQVVGDEVLISAALVRLQHDIG